LENLPPVSSKIVRIFTSSTFTGEISIVFSKVWWLLFLLQILWWRETTWCRSATQESRITVVKSTDSSSR
jgi:hypothetical protein